MGEALVSVIIPVYNRSQVVGRAIESVLSQSYKNFELIIVDDASSDETVEVLRKFENKYPQIKLILKEKNEGVSAARNTAARLAIGEWLAFLDSDDEWLPKKLETQLQLYAREERPLIHTEEIWIRNGVRVNQRAIHKKGGGDQFFRSLELCCISPSAAMIKKDLFWQLGGFDEYFEVCEDYDLWLRLTAKHLVSYIATAQIVKYGGHEDQLSRKYHGMDYFRLKALVKVKRFGKLRPDQLEAVEAHILHRTEILRLGYEKRGKQAELLELMEQL